MEPAHLIAFNVALLAAMASPGPAFLHALRMSVAGGFRAGAATGAGLGLMAAGWTALALVGLDGLFALVPWAYGAIRIAGALYLMYLAWRLWRTAAEPLADRDAAHGRAFLGGLLVNLANPKSVLFASAVLLVVFPQGLTGAEKALIVLNHLVVEVAVYGAVALAFASAPARARYLRGKAVADRVAAGLLGALGLRLLLERGA